MLGQVQTRVSRRFIIFTAIFISVVFFLWNGLDFATSRSSSLPAIDYGKYKYIPSSYDWSLAKVYHPVTDMKYPPSGTPRTLPKVQKNAKSSQQDDVANARKLAVKAAFVKSWEAYKTYAWTMDELMPLSAKGKQTFSGWAAQLVDALDTLWIMDLKDDFKLAVKEVAVIDWSKVQDGKVVNLFEVTIRYLGGLLAAYDLSQEPVLLGKAVELGNTLYATFDTPNRLPSHWLDFEKAKNGQTTADDSMSGAAGGTLCMEFTRLTQLTGDPKYYDATERIKQFFLRIQNETKVPGMWPEQMNYREEYPIENSYTLAGGGDSQYEYIVKMYPLLGGLDKEYEEMAITALETVKKTLLFKPMTPKDDNILLSGVASVYTPGQVQLRANMDHLTCFAGGMYALAGRIFERKDFEDIGSRITAGCVWLYDAFPTNIMAESSRHYACKNMDEPCPYDEALGQDPNGLYPPGFVGISSTAYLQRPEAIESVFYMWRITGDQIWRDAAWRMWEGIVAETETELAFATVKDVTKHGGTKQDTMETFWLAETLKYFYLIFEDESVINLDDWVFNTEAHPFKRSARK